MINLHVPFSAQISREEELKLLKQFKDGVRGAGDALLQYHTGLLVREVSRFQSPKEEESFLEVFSAACLGFTEALHKFDASLGHRISTYALWWVKHYIREEVSMLRSPNLKIPVQKQRKFFKEGIPMPKVILSTFEQKCSDDRQDSGPGHHYNANINLEVSQQDLATDGSIDKIHAERTSEIVLRAIEDQPLRLRFILRACLLPRPEDSYKWNTISCAKILGINKEYARQLRNRGVEKLKATLITRYGITSASDLYC